MWRYSQSGKLLQQCAGEWKEISQGYSGFGAGKNAPDLQNVPNVGPIPRGLWFILFPRNTDTHGPYVLPLMPAPSTETYGRRGFLIHGDSIHAPGAASHGCIILPRKVREQIWTSGDHQIEVVV